VQKAASSFVSLGSDFSYALSLAELIKHHISWVALNTYQELIRREFDNMSNALLLQKNFFFNANVGVLNVPEEESCVSTNNKANLVTGRILCLYNVINVVTLLKLGLC
jgi:uncharacterized membrane protein